MATTTTKFYLDRDGTLGRRRERRPMEVFQAHAGWFPYTLDTYHDARQITPEEALEQMPAGASMADLESTD